MNLPEKEPIRIRQQSYNWALVVLSLCLAAALWAMLKACVMGV